MAESKTPTRAQIDDLGPPNPEPLRQLAEDNLGERDEVQKAYKAALTADTGKKEVDAKVKIVEESPDAAETPSGYALLKVQGESNDVKRGERYLREKTARRWGYVPADES